MPWYKYSDDLWIVWEGPDLSGNYLRVMYGISHHGQKTRTVKESIPAKEFFQRKLAGEISGEVRPVEG